MSDINPLGASTYYGGLQNATSQAAREAKKEKSQATQSSQSTGKTKFSDILKNHSKTEAQLQAEAAGYPVEIASMSIEDAAVFLKDAVDKAGNELSENASTENTK